MRISQQGVGPTFKMRVPLYLDYEGQIAKMGDIPIVGATTTQEIKLVMPRRPRRVLVNANNDMLATVN